MHLDPKGNLTAVTFAKAEPIIPEIYCRVQMFRAQSGFKVNTAGESARFFACNLFAMFSLQRLLSGLIGIADRGGGSLDSILECHGRASCPPRATTRATISPTCPLNSLRPPQPAVALS